MNNEGRRKRKDTCELNPFLGIVDPLRRFNPLKFFCPPKWIESRRGSVEVTPAPRPVLPP